MHDSTFIKEFRLSYYTELLKNSVFWLIFWDAYSFVSLTYKGTYAKPLQVSYEMLTFYN